MLICYRTQKIHVVLQFITITVGHWALNRPTANIHVCGLILDLFPNIKTMLFGRQFRDFRKLRNGWLAMVQNMNKYYSEFETKEVELFFTSVGVHQKKITEKLWTKNIIEVYGKEHAKPCCISINEACRCLSCGWVKMYKIWNIHWWIFLI